MYVPELDYNGFDSFTFVTNDGIVDSALATVTIEVPPVNDAPVSDNQSVTTDEDTAIAITLQASDVDNINDELSYSIETGPSNGTLVGTGQNLQYVPNANFNGSDSFTFKTNDGEFDSNIATVSITVAAVNDAPVADDLSVTTAEDNALPITVTASDVEGSPLSFEIVDGPDHGTLSGTAPNLTYTPNANYFGDDSFTFKTNDGELDSNVATVAITVTPVNDAPVADDGSATTDEDAPAVITLTGSDIEDDALTYAIVDGPTNGTLELDGPQATYTPFGDYNGPDSFTFKVDDGDLDSNIATVTISVAAVNDAPVAGADVAGTPQYTSVTISVLANDSDIDGDALSVASATDGAKGSTTVNPDGTITYSPTPAFKDSDAFQYVLSDGQGGLATGTVMIVEVGCGEDGIDALAGGPAGGAASRTIDREVEPIVGSVDADLAANLHAYNCAYVVPAEDAVDDLIP